MGKPVEWPLPFTFEGTIVPEVGAATIEFDGRMWSVYWDRVHGNVLAICWDMPREDLEFESLLELKCWLIDKGHLPRE